MQIVSIQNCNQNFTSTHISSVKIKKIINGVEELIDANFTKLDPRDINDQDAVTAMMGIPYLDKFGYEYYAIELPNKENSERIAGIAKVTREGSNNNYFLSYMDTRNQFCYGNPERETKGVGEVLFGGVCHVIRTASNKSLRFISLADDFFLNVFKRAKLNKKKEGQMFILTKRNCKKIEKSCEKEYKFSYSA